MTEKDFPQAHLEVLQDLIKIYLGWGQVDEAKELQRRGSGLLRDLLARPSRSNLSKQQLALKFIGFNQLTVDLVLQSGDLVKALEVAEESKNACLTWILYAWSDEIRKPSWQQIHQLVNPLTAIVYWYISHYALHTFIIKHDAPKPILVSAPATRSTFIIAHQSQKFVLNLSTSKNEGKSGLDADDMSPLPAAVQRLLEFERWVTDWDRTYEDYRGKAKEEDSKNRSWQQGMPARLQQLAEILNVAAIETELAEIERLILIPHRDLHRFPLHALFSDEFTISYLPSAQIGLSLLQSHSQENSHPAKLLSLEHPESQEFPPLLFAEIESCLISWMFDPSNPNPVALNSPPSPLLAEDGSQLPLSKLGSTRLAGKKATRAALEAQLQQPHRIFHFTGHGTYNYLNPSRSALALSGSDLLTLADIAQMPFTRYQLIGIAACETALTGNQTITTEYVGLVSGFMRQGASCVLSTLWVVEDVSSTLLTIEFYRRFTAGMAPATALKQAQQWLRTVTYPELARWYRTRAQEIANYNSYRCEDLTDLAANIETDRAKMNSTQPPYADYYNWAGFVITGK